MKHYFFDLYGTLVDIRTDEGKPSLWRGTADFYALCGAPYRPAELRERYLSLCVEETAALAEASALPEDAVEIELRLIFRRLFEEKGAAVSDGRIEDTALLFRALSFCRAPRLMKGARRTLDELRRRGCRLYLLSNAQSGFTLPELRRLELLESFDAIFLSSDFGCKRPSPAFFRAAMERAGVSPSQLLMVGNDPAADIAGADALGIESRYLHSWQSPPRSGALPASCREIAGLEDLLKEE